MEKNYISATIGSYRLEENAKLQWPYRQLLALVECSFEPEENNQLRLMQGIHVRVIKTDGEYWKGKFGNQVSFSL